MINYFMKKFTAKSIKEITILNDSSSSYSNNSSNNSNYNNNYNNNNKCKCKTMK